MQFHSVNVFYCFRVQTLSLLLCDEEKRGVELLFTMYINLPNVN